MQRNCCGDTIDVSHVWGPSSAPTRFPSHQSPSLFRPARRCLPGLKYAIRCAGTFTGSPVFGFRPRRDFLTRVRNEPNPLISTLSSLRRASMTLLRRRSTTSAAFDRVIPVSKASCWPRFALVMVITISFYTSGSSPSVVLRYRRLMKYEISHWQTRKKAGYSGFEHLKQVI